MSSTRDQFRAARTLPHLRQDGLAKLAGGGTDTVERFEPGNDIRPVQAEAVTIALRNAGAILIDGSMPSDAQVRASRHGRTRTRSVAPAKTPDAP